MKTTYISLLITMILCVCHTQARDYQFQLAAGKSYLEADFNARHHMEEKGYLRTGAGVAYRGWDNKEYGMLHGTVGVGSASIVENLRFDLGFRVLGGKVEHKPNSGSAVGIGFNGSAGYTLPEKWTKIPIDLYAELTWAPDILSFSNMERYREFNTGVSFRVIETASLNVGYRSRTFDMKSDWGLNDSVWSLGVGIVF